MLESGQELGVPLPLTGLTRQLFQTAIAAGHGEEDICSTIKVLEEFGGRRSDFQKINTKNCCFQKWNLLLLELSRGGNSHQSETNL